MRRGPTTCSPAIATLVAMLLGLPRIGSATETTQAPDAAAEGDGEAAEDPKLAEARRLYDEGQVMYSAADYTGAIERFTEALALISRADGEIDPEVRGRLLYNLATAHDRAYNVEGDLKHLRKARELYSRIVDEAEVHGYSASLVEQSATQRDDVAARLEQAQAEQTTTTPDPQPQPQPQPVVTPPPQTDEPRRPGRGLTIAGWAVLGTGIASSGILIAGLVGAKRASGDITEASTIDRESERIDAFDRGARSNTLIVTGAIVSGALVAAGVGLVVAGAMKARREGGGSNVACGPGGPRGLGRGLSLGCAVRF